MAAAWATVVVGSFLRCRRTLMGTPIGHRPHGALTRKVITTRFSPEA
jgi:hypothetical protein